MWRFGEPSQRVSIGNQRYSTVTGMLFSAPPRTQYIPPHSSADSATAPEADEKARFSSFLYGSAKGTLEASFNIVKCTSKNAYDLGSPRLLRSEVESLLLSGTVVDHVPAVREVLSSWSIHREDLPPKITDHLRVMDLVVNGPLKAAIRRRRTRGLFNFFLV